MNFIKRIFHGFKRVSRINKLAEVLSKQETPLEMVNSWRSGKISATEDALNELFTLIESEPHTKYVIELHKADREVLRGIYYELNTIGGGQFVRGLYLPVWSLAMPQTLFYLLKNRGSNPFLKLDRMLLFSYYQKLVMCLFTDACVIGLS